MSAPSVAMALFLAASSVSASSDVPLLLELQNRNPKADIWPKQSVCAEKSDCLVTVSSLFKYGRWRVTNWDCIRKAEKQEIGDPGLCTEYFNWSLGHIFDPRESFDWLDAELKSSGRIDSPVYVGEVTALLDRKSGPNLYLIQRRFFRPVYHLVEEEPAKGTITTVKEYSLDCRDARKDSWERKGYRHHDGEFEGWRVDYCEIRDLDAFRNLARSALKKAPFAIWQHVADLPADELGGEEP